MSEHYQIVPTEGQKNVPCTTPKAIPTDHEMMVFQTMAEHAVSSKMYRGIGEKAGVMMIMLSARELGIPPMQALNGGINIIQGKVEISARMMSAIIRKAGHKIEIRESTDECCVLVGTRFDTKETSAASFSIAEATRAGLVKAGGGWTKWPKDMCFARALSRLARQLFSDVIGMGYVEGEILAHAEVVHRETIEEKPVEVQIEVVPSVEEYINLFPKEDKPKALEYLEIVRINFGWDIDRTLKTLIEKKDLLDCFNAWRAQNG